MKNLSTDLIRELIQRLLSAAHRDGTLSEAVALEIERQWRRENKGLEIRISYRPRPPSETKQLAVRDYLADRPIEEVTSAHGISRATLYRCLKK